MDLVNNCVLVPEWVLGQCHNVSSVLPAFVVRSWNLVGSYSVCDTGVQHALSSGPQYAWGEFDAQKVAILLLQPCEFSLTLRGGPARCPQFMGDISVLPSAGGRKKRRAGVKRRISPPRELSLLRPLLRDSWAAHWFRVNEEGESRYRLLHRLPPGTSLRLPSTAY